MGRSYGTFIFKIYQRALGFIHFVVSFCFQRIKIRCYNNGYSYGTFVLNICQRAVGSLYFVVFTTDFNPLLQYWSFLRNFHI